MVNFYDILGVNINASPSEIKSAFRSLAKIFHPDKNPNGQEEFKKILRAYETLINPSRKSSYDLKLKYHKNAGAHPKTSVKKSPHTAEKEMKRKQYYEEHIKKHEKIKKTKAEAADLKTNYNEYKYILFATPIAVALFLLILKLAASSEPKNIEVAYISGSNQNKRVLKMGDSPYSEHFGNQRYNTTENKKLTVKNNSGSDIILCLFSEIGFIRSCFIENGYFAEIPQLPKKNLILRYSVGLNWDFDYRLKEAELYGAFTKDLNFYKSVTKTELGPINEITLTSGLNDGFVTITEKDFFNKD